MNVIVLLLSNKHGRNVYVCADFDVAHRQLERCVDERWDEAMSCSMSRCGNCLAIWPARYLDLIEDLDERVSPGEIVPSGQCIGCGALCYSIGLRVSDKPENVDEKIERYFEAVGEWESYEFFDVEVIMSTVGDG